MFREWLGSDLEDWFFMETSVLRRFGVIYFPARTGFGKTESLRLFPIDPDPTKVLTKTMSWFWSKVNFMDLLNFDLSAFSCFCSYLWNMNSLLWAENGWGNNVS